MKNNLLVIVAKVHIIKDYLALKLPVLHRTVCRL